MVHGVVANRLGVKRRAEWAKCPGENCQSGETPC